MQEFVARLEVGDPMMPDTDLGPLISHEAMQRVEDQVARALKDGATLKLGGGKVQPPALPGHCFQPTILSDVRHGSVATREEIFGPVLSITTVADADEAIRLANDSEYGLGASIYTKDLATAMRAMQSIKAGTFWINDPLTDNDAAPFGGMRHSGIGRELDPRGLTRSANPNTCI